MGRKTAWIGMVALVMAAAVVRAIHLDWGFPEVHEEATPVRQAIAFWGVPGTGIDLNPHFFKYPSFTFYIHFAAQAVWYFWLSLTGQVGSLNEFRQILDQNLTQAVFLGRWVQVVLGALVVIPTVVLARRLAGEIAGWCAGLMVVVLPALVIESQLVGPDMALTLFVASALAAATEIVVSGRRSAYLWFGLWMGLATASKYPGALLIVALLGAHWERVRVTREGPSGLLLSSLLWQGVVIGGLVFATASPYVMFDIQTALADIGFERRHMVLGHLGREEGRAWSYYLTNTLPAGWTYSVCAAAFLGVIALLVKPTHRSRLWPGLIFAVVMFLVLGSWRMAAPRYLLPLAPLGAVWTGSLIGITLDHRLFSSRPLRLLMVIVVGAILTWPTLVTTREVGFRGRVDSRIAAGEWIDREVPDGSSILVERYGPEPDPGRYAVLYLPFHGVTPRLYDGAYMPLLYREFDYVVLSSGVSARYLARPREYPHQVALYGSLDRELEEVAAFSPGLYLGPEVRVLKRTETSWPETAKIPSSYFERFQGNGPLAEFFSALGTVLVRQGHDDRGFSILQEAVNMAPENAKVWGNLGAMRLRVGEIQEALNAFVHARDLEPQDPDLWLNFAALYDEMGELQQASDAFKAAIKLRPEKEDPYLSLARVLVKDDRYAEARVILREFLFRFPRSEKRASAEEALSQLARMGMGKS